jgi:hypothetical protein
MTTRFSGGRFRSTRREPPTMGKQLVNFSTCGCESSAPFLAHLAFRPCELLPSLFVRRPSVNISHFNLLLRNRWANCNQTLMEWSLGGPLPKLPTSNQDAHQAKNRKRGDELKKNLLFWNYRDQSQPKFAEMILGWSPSKIVSGILDLRPRWPPQPSLI